MERTVVFDLAGVICHFHPERKVRALAEATGLRADRVRELVWDSGLDLRADAGEFTIAEYVEVLNTTLGTDLPQETFREAWAAGLVIDEGVLDFVRAVSVPTAVFSNNGPLLSDVFNHELAPVRDAVAAVVVSWQTGAIKPDRQAFEGLGAIIQVAPAEMIMVDDSEDNVTGARAAGIDAIHYTDLDSLRRQLLLRHVVVNSPHTDTAEVRRQEP